MSAIDDENSNICDNSSDINEETSDKNTETTLNANVQQPADSNKNTNIIGGKSPNTPQSVTNVTLEGTNEDSGDYSPDILNENVKSDKVETQLAKTEELTSDAPKCGGDFIAKTSDVTDTKSDVPIPEVGSKSTDLDKEGANSPINNSNNIMLATGDDQIDEVEDDDMKLTWDDDDDDDDTSEQATTGGDEKSVTNKNSEILSKPQPLEENDTNIDTAEVKKTSSEDNVLKPTKIHLTMENLNAEIDISMEMSIQKDNDEILEDELLEESDIDAESTQISSQVNIAEEIGEENGNENQLLTEKSADINSTIDPQRDIIAIKDNSLIPSSQDSQINSDSSKILSDKVITTETEEENAGKPKDEKKILESESKAEKDVSKVKDVDDDDLMLEEQLLEETETSIASYDAIPEQKVSITEVKNVEENVDLMLEKQLLEETEKNIVSSDVILENQSITEDLDNVDEKLEEKLLEETEVIPEVNISITKGDGEEELLKDDGDDKNDESQEEIAMCIDITDQSNSLIDDQFDINKDITIDHGKTNTKNDNVAKIEIKNPDIPINDQGDTKIDQQINDETEFKSVDQTIDSPHETELNTDRPLETGLVEMDTTVPVSPNNKIEVENKAESEKILSTDTTETINEDVTMNISNISSISPEDSPIRNKTHGLHKPDVMLEIPTQELIDIDIDLSINLDQTDGVDSPSVEVNENAENKVLEVKNNDQSANIGTENVVTEKAEDSVAQKTIEENMEQMFADHEPPSKETVESIATANKPKDSDVQPSTSFTMTPDTADEVPEVSDSLGLLAESSGRVMEDDEEPEDDDDADDDDDFDQDESSNHVSAEQSEDSNAAPSETEPVRDQEEKDLETPESRDTQFNFTIDNAECSSREKAEKMEIEVEEYGTLQLQAESINDEETKSAVNALLKESEGTVEETIEDPKTTEPMDIETVKLSDTSENEAEEPSQEEQAKQTSKDKDAKDKSTKSAAKESPSKQSPSKESPKKQSPSKLQKLAISTMQDSNVVNIVDLEESSSSEDDIQEVKKQPEADIRPDDKPASPDPTVTNINIPTGIDVMCTSGGNTSEITTKEGEVVISGIPKPPPQKPARLNTSEVSIKTASNAEPLVIPETKINEQNQTEAKGKPKLGLEIFSLDSDDDEGATKEKPVSTSPHKMTALELEKARETSKCINYCCTSGKDVAYKVADAATVAYYDAGRKRRSMVCQPCADVVANRTKNLVQGIKDLTPLLDLEMAKMSQDLVEISDSESEDEDMTPDEPKESIGEKGAKFLEENLAQILNETWTKYDMDCRLKETQIMLDDEIERLEQDSKEIDAMLNECQIATDKLRCELYATFEHRRHERPAIVVFDTPEYHFIGSEDPPQAAETTETRQAKRRLSSCSETVAKRPAIPLGYAPLDADTSSSKDQKAVIPAPDSKLDDDKDVSVVKLSAEAAPADLPPPGEISRPPLRISMPVYAMRNAFGPWLKGRILEIQPKGGSSHPFSLCRVKFDHKTKTQTKVLPARCIAYAEPADVRMTIGTRLIAMFQDANKRESYYSGVVAEIPNPVNNYRYLVFFDDGYAQYVQHSLTRLVCESSTLVWEEVHPFSRDFVRDYLLAYPERPMVRLHEGQHLKTEWDGKWWSSRVIKVDASLAQVMFVGDGRREWIYRGSTRLAPLYLELRAAERHRPRPMPRSKAQPRSNMPYVEYTRSDEPESKQTDTQTQEQQQQQQQNEEIRRQRSVAKKSTSVPQTMTPAPPQPATNTVDPVTSRVVYYTPKNAVKPYKMTPHRCGPKCKRSDVLSLKELRTYNPLAKPLLSGWERQIVRFKGHKEVMYRAPCGRRVRHVKELHSYLRATESDLPVDLFDFHPATHCLAEFVLNKCLVGKKDLSHGKENVPVPCVNYYDESLPEFCSYNTERTPTAGVPLNLDPEFLCGCDCTDDCQDKSKCACWKMTLEGARTIGLEGPNVGYVYKRLPEPLPSGIYECNSRCKCKHTCLNRVAQHPLQLKLQVFKTPNRGWGIRALNDVPKGSFLCVYAGNLLTDATANLDGLNEGDEYLAELDYIEVVEQMKEGYEEDIPEADKKLDKKEKDDDEDSEPSSSDEDDTAATDKEDDDFQPGYIGLGVQEFSKRLRRREKSKKEKEGGKQKEKDKEKEKDKDTKDSNADDDCITISDDEEVREPSRFTVQVGMGAGEFISKYKSVRTLFGKDEACYIMDAKVQGNIGRYLNHSCCPNVFVQNVFVDTHDPRFPWVAFFALSHIKAGTELTWNYNYDVGSVPGKILYCYCGAANCRGRLL